MIADAARKGVDEESPGSIGQWCRVTPGKGDFKESATEIYRILRNVRVERRGKSSPATWRLVGYVNPTWSNAVEGRNDCPSVPGRWLELYRNVWPR